MYFSSIVFISLRNSSAIEDSSSSFVITTIVFCCELDVDVDTCCCGLIFSFLAVWKFFKYETALFKSPVIKLISAFVSKSSFKRLFIGLIASIYRFNNVPYELNDEFTSS